MLLSRLNYFGEFFVLPPIALAYATAAFSEPHPPRLLAWLVVYGGALFAWTLIEYLVHRFVFHCVGFFMRMHDLHHDDPRGLIGTPAWMSVGLGLAVVVGPSWLLLGAGLGSAVVAGMTTGYQWYALLHYCIHQGYGGDLFYFRWARLRHAKHHYLAHGTNFGVTTGFWDIVFRTSNRVRNVSQHKAAVGV
jgi:sterol desaturase/sphingolipid hydroxylase (fatty acid hydroxylase superfamily)